MHEALPVLLLFIKWRETDQLGRIPYIYTDGESLKGISYHNFAPRFLEKCSISNFMNFLFSTLIGICTMKSNL